MKFLLLLFALFCSCHQVPEKTVIKHGYNAGEEAIFWSGGIWRSKPKIKQPSR